MRRSSLVIVLLALVAVAAPARSEDGSDLPEVLRGLEDQAIWETAKIFAADEMKGRKTGFASGAAAEMWVAAKMGEMGLHPADGGGTYLEPFVFDSANTEGPIHFRFGKKERVYGTDYFDLIYGGDGTVEAEIVFVGYGIHRPDAGWDDYAKIDVKGKIAMAIRGAPASRQGEFLEERYIGYKSSTAADQGAAGFILVEAQKASTGTIQARFHRGPLPAIWATEAVADDILAGVGKRLKKEKASRDAGTPGVSFATGVTATLEVHSRFKPRATGHNVLGLIKGRDPDLAREVILVGAHLDHLGIDPTGNVFNGADDNASGTSVLLHLADQLTQKHWKPKRTVVFCAFGAEEQGLYGSTALARQLPFPCDGIVCLLNMDMVGQGDPKVRVSGVGNYPRLHRLLVDMLPGVLKDDVHFSLRTAPNGDHWPFHERGIPAFFIATEGKHPNYHTPLDDIERIRPELLGVVARTVGSFVVRLGEHPESLLDPQDLPRYLLHEGPRFAVVSAAEAKTVAADALLEAGVTALLVDVGPTDDLAGTAKALTARAKLADSRFTVAHSVSAVQSAYNRAKVALVLRARVDVATAADAEALRALRKLGYWIVAPYAAGGPATPEAGARILDATRTARLRIDLSGLDATHLTAAREALGTRKALLFRPVGASAETVKALRAAAGPETLLLCLPGAGGSGFGVAGDGPTVVCSGAGQPLTDEFAAWCGGLGNAWSEPGSPARGRIRQVLGGDLLAWLRPAR